jgi:hypothetical protein
MTTNGSDSVREMGAMWTMWYHVYIYRYL